MSVIRAPANLPVSGSVVSETNGDSNGKENVSDNGNIKVEKLLHNIKTITAFFCRKAVKKRNCYRKKQKPHRRRVLKKRNDIM